MLDAKGNILYIQGPNGMSITADPGNSRYQDFLAVDTDAHLCERVIVPDPGKHSTNAGRQDCSP